MIHVIIPICPSPLRWKKSWASSMHVEAFHLLSTNFVRNTFWLLLTTQQFSSIHYSIIMFLTICKLGQWHLCMNPGPIMLDKYWLVVGYFSSEFFFLQWIALINSKVNWYWSSLIYIYFNVSLPFERKHGMVVVYLIGLFSLTMFNRTKTVYWMIYNSWHYNMFKIKFLMWFKLDFLILEII
jgi:hypothetical protein